MNKIKTSLIIICLIVLCVSCRGPKKHANPENSGTASTFYTTSAQPPADMTVNSGISYSGDSLYYRFSGKEVKNAGKKGYSESNEIEYKDPHYSWTLGDFIISGFTRHEKDDEGKEVFLKNVGDAVVLRFDLKQDIDCLNGQNGLSISEDKNGYDQALGEDKTNFGRGTLFIVHKDYQGNSTRQMYRDFLVGGVQNSSLRKIELNEEGDYQVVLDYEIKEKKGLLPFYNNYRISFWISIRNGNCMVFAFDVDSGSELVNRAYTPNGFCLDLARSRYLTIDIKKEVLNELKTELVPDVRFNKPARDGNKYEEDGIYTILVKNKYTGAETEKKIYVGENGVLKAYVVTGMSIPDIQKKLDEGAWITSNGTLAEMSEAVRTFGKEEAIEIEPQNNNETEAVIVDTPEAPLETSDKFEVWHYVLAGIFIVLCLGWRRKHKSEKNEKSSSL